VRGIFFRSHSGAKALFLLLFFAAARPAVAEDFASYAKAAFSTGPFSNATVGAIFLTLPNGATAFSVNAESPLLPASLGKLATTAAALQILTRDFRFRTELLAKKTELRQNRLSLLVWRGDGDPSISGRGRASPLEIFELWASSIAAQGITRIDRLALDASAFTGPAVIESWPKEELSYWYEAETSAISFNDNCVALKFMPDPKPGRRPVIELQPDFGYVRMKNRATTGPAGSAFTLDYRRKLSSNKVRFFGAIAADSPDRFDFVAVHEPALFAAHTLREVLRRRGIKLDKVVIWKKPRVQDEDLLPILVWDSPPLHELIKVINKNSQNFYAEQVLRAMGRKTEGPGSFAAGLRALEAFLTGLGLGGDIRPADGSGLSPLNRATAAGLARLLFLLGEDPVYRESLGIPGRDRSMRNRMAGELLAERMRLKGGTVSGARNLAGYLESHSGARYAFVILVNGPALDRKAVDAGLDQVCGAAIRLLP
jgi:D-alanyl-D-alanine carboxypeptidase/D-alanyl-D-alanine-endopeptidase (penicillin-binding protein 4)